MCTPHRTTPNTHLVNLPIKRNVGYHVGAVTKKWFSCQRNQPLEEDVSYRLGWLSVTVCTLVPSKAPFSNPPISCGTAFWPPNCCSLVTVLLQSNVELHFDLFFMVCLMVVGGVALLWKYMIDASAGKSVIAASCAWLGFCWCQARIGITCLAPVADRSAETLLAIVKACILPSTTVVSDCWGYNASLCNGGLVPLHQSLFEFRGT